MEINVLARQNPWWINNKLILSDIDIKRWLQSKIKWIPNLLNEISLKPFSLNIIFGPRQVGKTTIKASY